MIQRAPIPVWLAALLVAACAAGEPGQGSDDTQVPDTDAATATDGGDAGLRGAGPGEENVMIPWPRDYPRDGELRLNHLQLKGTHNSYHLAQDPPLLESYAYSHLPLDQQLELQGIRQLELDLHVDSEGTLRVFHLPVVDPLSTCELFEDCLAQVDLWSREHPWHAPIFLWLEPKDIVDPVPLNGHYDAIDEALRSAFGDRLITPDDIRGEAETLREVVVAGGWPTLAEARGHVLAILLDDDKHQYRYTHGGTSLEGRAMFVRMSDLELPYAAFAKYNDPTSEADEIRSAVDQGFIVACNAGFTDASDETNQARVQAGLESGAHMIGTDIPAPWGENRFWFELPEGVVALCNPRSAPADCQPFDIE